MSKSIHKVLISKNQSWKPKDEKMPELERILDPKKMLSVFRAQLRPIQKGKYLISDCKIHRFRYRKGNRAIVQYQLMLKDSATNNEKKLWLTGIVRNKVKRVTELYDRVLRSDSWRNIRLSSLIFEPVLLLPDLKCLIQVYPQDHHLPTLSLLLKNQDITIQNLLNNHLASEVCDITAYQLISLRYRPLLGETFLCNVKGKCPDRNFKIKKSFYFKIFQEKDGQKSFELLSKLKQAFPTTKKGIQVVNALGYSEALQMLILEPAPGIPLNKLFLTESTPWSAIENALRKTAKALAEFHLSPSVFSKTRSVDGHLHRAEKLVRFIQNLCPELEEKSNRFIAGLESSLQRVRLCPTHLDLKLEHIFIDEERITLIDLDSFAMSDPVFDVASLIVRIEYLSQSSGISQAIIKAAVKVFTECYFSSVPIHWKERLHSNYCCASLKVAVHLLQHQETDAENRVSAILEHCNTQGL